MVRGSKGAKGASKGAQREDGLCTEPPSSSASASSFSSLYAAPRGAQHHHARGSRALKPMHFRLPTLG